MFGLSPLPTVHPPPFQRRLVRSSSWFYPTFNLTMGRSPGFGSNTINLYRPIKTRFRYGSVPVILNLAYDINSLAHYAKGTPSQDRNPALTACRHTVSGSISLPSRGAFHLSLTVLLRYQSPNVFSLTRRSSLIPTGFPRSRSTRVSLHVAPHVPSTGLSPYIVSLSRLLRLHEPGQHPCR